MEAFKTPEAECPVGGTTRALGRGEEGVIDEDNYCRKRFLGMCAESFSLGILVIKGLFRQS